MNYLGRRYCPDIRTVVSKFIFGDPKHASHTATIVAGNQAQIILYRHTYNPEIIFLNSKLAAGGLVQQILRPLFFDTIATFLGGI